MAKARKSGLNRKSDRTTAQLGMPQPSTLAQIAASRGVSEATLFADDKLGFRGEKAEDTLKKFKAWLIKFAMALHENKIRSEAWDELKFKCDVLMLLQELYAFTCIGSPLVIRSG